MMNRDGNKEQFKTLNEEYKIFNSPKTAETKSHNPLKLSIVKQEIKGPSVENRKDSYQNNLNRQFDGNFLSV